jgi:hypothetical protein
MDPLPTFLDGALLLLGLVMMVASFISKIIVWGRMAGGKPEKITWFGRVFMFLAGSILVFQSGLNILKELHIAANPAWTDLGLPLSEVVLFALFLALAIPFLIAWIRDSWQGRREGARIERIIPVCLSLIFLYLIWETAPEIISKVLTLLHHLSRGHSA